MPSITTSIKRHRKKADRPPLHSLISGALAQYEVARETDSGYLKPTKKRMLDLLVSKDTLKRGVELANEFFLLLEDYGYDVSLADRERLFSRTAVEERESGGTGRHYPDLWHPGAPTVVFIETGSA